MEITSPERMMFPEVGVTKGEMVGYYAKVQDQIFPFLDQRALTLERYPRGITQKGFMQKNAAEHFPASIHRYSVPKTDGGVTIYPVVTRSQDVPYLANQGTVSFHVWLSRVDRVDYPDYLTIDLDPEPGDVDRARTVTASVGRLLAEFGMESQPVATGSKGFHVWAPILPETPWERVATAARALAGLVTLELASIATMEFLKKNRHGRVFVDWLRNHPGATVVAPLSLRPSPAASLSMPITWEELAESAPAQWTIRNVDERLSRLPEWPSPGPLPDQEMEDAARQAGVDLDSEFDRFGRDR